MGSDRVATVHRNVSSFPFILPHFALSSKAHSFIFINRSLPLLRDSEIGAAPVLAFTRAIHFLL